MIHRRLWQRVASPASLVLALSAFVLPCARGDDSLVLVDEVVQRSLRNIQSIQTWHGKAKIIESSVVEGLGAPAPRSERVVEFWYDRDKGSTRNVVHWKAESQTLQRDGTILKGNEQEFVGNRMMQNGVLLKLNDVVRGEERSSPRILFVRGPARRSEGDQLFFDPRAYFLEPGKMHPAEILRTLRPIFGEGARERTGVRREGALVIVEVNSLRSINEYTFDLSRGGNLIKYHAEGEQPKPPNTKLVIEIQYEDHEGVFVPSKWHSHLQSRTREDRVVTVERQILFSENAVNKPIPPEELSVEAMGLQLGDWIRDERTGKKMRYTGDFKPEPTTRPATAPQSSSRGMNGAGAGPFNELFWLVVIGVPLLLPIAATARGNVALLPAVSRDATGWSRRLKFWIPRVIGVILLVGGFARIGDREPIEKVLLFDGFPGWLVPGLAWGVVLAEIALGQGLIVGWAGRRALLFGIGLLTVYSIQIGLLLMFENAPDCGCYLLVKAFENSRHTHMVGLLRNGLLIAALAYAYRMPTDVRRSVQPT